MVGVARRSILRTGDEGYILADDDFGFFVIQHHQIGVDRIFALASVCMARTSTRDCYRVPCDIQAGTNDRRACNDAEPTLIMLVPAPPKLVPPPT